MNTKAIVGFGFGIPDLKKCGVLGGDLGGGGGYDHTSFSDQGLYLSEISRGAEVEIFRYSAMKVK